MTILTGDFADAAAIPLQASAGVLPGASTQAATAPLAPDAAEPRAVLPEDARLYLRHVEGGESIRALARETGCHASTVLRRIRRFENRRDDPLIDRAVERAGRDAATDGDRAEIRRVLRRLAEQGVEGANSAADMPMGPAPVTSTRSAAVTPPRRMPCAPMARNSIIAASRRSIPPAGMTLVAGTDRYSAIPPSVCTPSTRMFMHALVSPLRQAAQLPQAR